MKRIFLLLLALSSGILTAQNYQNICSPGISYYRDEIFFGQWGAFSRDSVVALPNQDTIFYSYKAIRDSAGTWWLDYSNGSVIWLSQH
ncbi:MAG: hypothetical protein WCK34_03325 [Bacteroidota bacterium]